MSTQSDVKVKNPGQVVASMVRTAAVAIILISALVLSPGALADTESATYDVPGSVVVRGIFGFGMLFCASPGLQPVHEAVRNGACFDYTGDIGKGFVMAAQDLWWSDTSVTIAVDVNGDGCISESCNGVPNTANDYRLSNCGPVFGILPVVESNVQPIVQVFLRGVDVTEELEICGATTGDVFFTSF